MWTSLSVNRCFILLSLAAVVLLSLEVDSYTPNINLPCCRKVSNRRIQEISECYEETPRDGCKIHAYRVKSNKGEWCIKPTAKWLTSMIQKGELDCPPILSLD